MDGTKLLPPFQKKKVCGRRTRQESPDIVIGGIKHHMETLAFCSGNFWDTLEKKNQM
jgi:hypothetical protein